MKRTMPIGLNSLTDPRVAKRLNRKVSIGVLIGFVFAFGFYVVGGTIAGKVFKTKEDIQVEEWRAFLKYRQSNPELIQR